MKYTIAAALIALVGWGMFLHQRSTVATLRTEVAVLKATGTNSVAENARLAARLDSCVSIPKNVTYTGNGKVIIKNKK